MEEIRSPRLDWKFVSRVNWSLRRWWLPNWRCIRMEISSLKVFQWMRVCMSTQRQTAVGVRWELRMRRRRGSREKKKSFQSNSKWKRLFPKKITIRWRQNTFVETFTFRTISSIQITFILLFEWTGNGSNDTIWTTTRYWRSKSRRERGGRGNSHGKNKKSFYRLGATLWIRNGQLNDNAIPIFPVNFVVVLFGVEPFHHVRSLPLLSSPPSLRAVCAIVQTTLWESSNHIRDENREKGESEKVNAAEQRRVVCGWWQIFVVFINLKVETVSWLDGSFRCRDAIHFFSFQNLMPINPPQQWTEYMGECVCVSLILFRLEQSKFIWKIDINCCVAQTFTRIDSHHSRILCKYWPFRNNLRNVYGSNDDLSFDISSERDCCRTTKAH